MDLTNIRFDANKFKAAREKKAMTQAEVAQAVGVEKAAISKYEVGVGLPSAEVLAKLCALYDVTLADFLDEAAEA